MKKLLLSFFVIVLSAFYILIYQRSLTAREAIVPAPANITTSQTIPTTANNPTTPPPSALTPPPPPAPAVANNSPYRDGTYTGVSADAYYGNVQVKVIIAGGRLTDVVFLDHPQDQQTSQYINSQAMPLLKQEAIQAQSAAVDGVSGATETSRGFKQSLASALAMAAR